MKTEIMKKIFTITGLVFVTIFIFGVSFNVAEASCPKGKVCYSNSGCGNFNIGSKHYGGSQACEILGKNCSSGGGGGGGGNPTPVDPCTYTPPSCGVCGGCCPANGFCSAINGKVVSKNPGSQGCSSNYGISGPTLSGDKYNWVCQATCGGNPASCSAYAMPQVGKCGDQFTSGSTAFVETLPDASIICKRGNPTSPIVGSDNFTWKCTGNGGASDSEICTAKKVSEGQIATIFSTSTPVTYLTVTGRITPNIVNKGQYCTLSDLEYTTNPGANDSLVACGVYRGALEYPDKAESTLNYQVEPGYEYEFRCRDYNTGVEGKTQPLKCVLNPTILER